MVDGQVLLSNKEIKRLRLWLGLGFALVLVAGAVLTVLSWVRNPDTESSYTLLPEDTSPAVRLLLMFVFLGLSWFTSRMLFKRLVRAELPVGDATNIAYVCLFYLLLILGAAIFLGVFYWFLFPLFFFILIVLSTIVLWEILGGGFTAGALAAALAAGLITFYLFG
jgi:hypothetical protein